MRMGRRTVRVMPSGVGKGVGVAVGVGVVVAVGEAVGEGVRVGEGVGDGVVVAVGVQDGVAVAVGVGVSAGEDVREGMTEAVGSGVEGTGLGVAVGRFGPVAPASDPTEPQPRQAARATISPSPAKARRIQLAL